MQWGLVSRGIRKVLPAVPAQAHSSETNRMLGKIWQNECCHMHLYFSVSNLFFHGKRLNKPFFLWHFVVWEKPIRRFEIKWSIELYLTVSSASFSCMIKWSTLPIDIPWCLPLRFYFRAQCDCSIRGARAMTEWSQGGSGLGQRRGWGTPSAPSVTDPMTPFTTRRPMRKPLIPSQRPVSHFITCHNDKSPGNARDAHFKLMKWCNSVDSQEDCFTKAL